MDIFRLTYFLGSSEKDKWDCSNRYEVYGSREAIADLYLHFKNLEKFSDEGKYYGYASPRYIDILNKDGQSQLKDFQKHGLWGLSNNNTFE